MPSVTMFDRVKVIQGDITQQPVEAIVNPANCTLLGGGGVDGDIHREAGPHLVWECRKLGGCPTGEARITKGHFLPVKHIIHAVGPMWQNGEAGEEELLSQTYRSAFALVEMYGLQSLAVPPISVGVYRFPPDRATAIAVRETWLYLQRTASLKLVLFVCADRTMYDLYVTHVRGMFR